MKLNLNAHLYHKADDYRAEPCVVEKIVEVSKDEFAALYRNPLREFDFIRENKEGLRCDESGVNHCLLVLGEGSNDGILICSEGYDYARYSAHIPNARQIVFMEQRYNCVQDLESALMSAADEVSSSAEAYDGIAPFRILISDLSEKHHFDEVYTPLLIEMLSEHSNICAVEDIGDEITVWTNALQAKEDAENLRPSVSPLPFSPDRAGQLLDKALDWIGTMESGGELYNTLVEKLNMSDEEISAAGFDTLSEYFEDPDEDEDAGMKLE
jgi:hypothetical protein